MFFLKYGFKNVFPAIYSLTGAQNSGVFSVISFLRFSDQCISPHIYTFSRIYSMIP